MPGQTPKLIVSNWRNLWRLSAGKKINFILLEILQRCCKLAILGPFGMLGYAYPKCYYKITEHFCLSAGKKSTLSSIFFWRYCKDMQTTYFGYFGQAWLCPPKKITSTCRKLWCLCACQKWLHYSLFSSWDINILNNPTIWLANSIFTYNLRTRISSEMRLVVKCQ